MMFFKKQNKVCSRFCRQLYLRKLPIVNSFLNLRVKTLLQHTIFENAIDRTLWILKRSKSIVFLNKDNCKNRRRRASDIIPSIFFSFRVSKQKKRWKEAETYTESSRNWVRDIPYHSLDNNQNWQCLMENRNSRHVWLETYLRWPKNSRAYSFFSKIAELKHT